MSENGTITEPTPFKKKVEMARQRNAEMVVSNAHTLLIDLDYDKNPHVGDQFHNGINFLSSNMKVVRVDEWPSKSGGLNTHVRIQLSEPLSATERIALQAALGSDPIREMLAVFQNKHSADTNTILFKPLREAQTEDFDFDDGDHDLLPF